VAESVVIYGEIRCLLWRLQPNEPNVAGAGPLAAFAKYWSHQSWDSTENWVALKCVCIYSNEYEIVQILFRRLTA